MMVFLYLVGFVSVFFFSFLFAKRHISKVFIICIVIIGVHLLLSRTEKNSCLGIHTIQQNASLGS